jgi:hypothetical protein
MKKWIKKIGYAAGETFFSFLGMFLSRGFVMVVWMEEAARSIFAIRRTTDNQS